MKEQYEKYLTSLFDRAAQSDPFGALCSILRVGGYSDINMDPYVESVEAFKDYNWMLQEAYKRGLKSHRRIALLMYCQAVEMSAPHSVIANLLRCASGQPYILNPFGHLARKKNKKSVLPEIIPPSAKAKFEHIKKLGSASSDAELPQLINSFFHDGVRNAFSHSNYILTDSDFYGPHIQDLSVDHLDELIVNCFAFYTAFMTQYSLWKRGFGQLKRYHKWPNYEVFEILKNNKNEAIGFVVHFSNGSNAKYVRTPQGTETVNIHFNDGQIGFMLGLVDNLERKWKIDGREVTDWSALE